MPALGAPEAVTGGEMLAHPLTTAFDWLADPPVPPQPAITTAPSRGERANNAGFLIG
jgi:hypothetical protein